MRQKIVYSLVFMLVFSATVGAMASTDNLKQSKVETTDSRAFTHTILGEFGTKTTCIPCKYAHAALKEIYDHKEEWGYPFEYITLVQDKNKHAEDRANELNIFSDPTVFWDGDFRNDQGGVNKSWCMGKYNQSLISCGNRDVADIDISVDVEWFGAVNRVPEDGETNVHIQPTLSWNITAMNIDVTVDNNEASTYNGHIHVYVTEVNSSYWVDKFHFPYTFALLDYAWNEDIQISAGGSWQDSMEWDGCDYDNGMQGEYYINFDEVEQDNVMIITSVFDEDTDYSDETLGTLAGIDTYPKTHDVYFGNTSPPPQVSWNQTGLDYSPGILPWNTTYYWRVVTWDNQDNKDDTPIFNFTTRDNHAPNVPSNPNPPHNSTTAPIDINITWTGGDPDGDLVYYDVYFGDQNPPLKISSNQTYEYYNPPGELEFDTYYFWKIVAWDRYGETSAGPDWIFKTEKNKEPLPPRLPIPSDGETNVPIQTNLSWFGGDPNSGDKVTYDIYFEEDDTDPGYFTTIGPYEATQLELEFDLPENLTIYKTYYWKIKSTDKEGLTTTGPVWSFNTGKNYPPEKPKINGENDGTAEVDYNYTFSAEDPENENVSYYINWGDTTNTGWLGPYFSGTEIKLSHNWSKGKYTIRAKAKDKFDQESGESTFDVKMPKSKHSILIPFIKFLHNLIQRFPWLEKVLTIFPVFNRILNV